MLKFDEKWKVPYNYSSPTVDHLVPFTGIVSDEDLDQKLTEIGKKQDVVISVNEINPGMEMKMNLVLQEEIIGQNSKQNPFKLYNFFYFNSEGKGNKMGLITERVKVSQTQITLLTLVFIFMVCGIVMCISYRYIFF